jgi:LemA protein
MNLQAVIIIVVIVAVVALIVGSYNKLVRQQVVVDEAFATMDVYLKKRFDLIPNLVETVKGYAKHEQSTLQNVIRLRNENYSGMDVEQKMEHDAALSREIPKIMALAESYPDLKANKNFMELGSQLQKLEEDIANSRKYYNGAVRNYNIAIQTVPTNIIAGIFGFRAKKMFEIENARERENVQINL